MTPIRVLVADDSIVYRSQIKAALGRLPFVEVVGVASNGRLALDRLSQLRVDLLLLDLEMPELNGIETLVEMQKLKHLCKTLVFSSVSKRGAEITLEALKLGASDFVTKPSSEEASLQQTDPTEKIRSLLEPKIMALFPEACSNVEGGTSSARPERDLVSEAKRSTFARVSWALLKPKIVVIGSSTGGPNALDFIFSQMNGPYNCPILITQHMPPVFTATLAERLSRVAKASVKEAKDGQLLKSGEVYIAPGDFHMCLSGTAENARISLNQAPQINSVRPAVDPLFETAAAIFGERVLGVVLTGMGADGKLGAIAIKKKNGAVLIQDKESCVVFGMPGAVYEAGAFDKIASLNEIPMLLAEKLCDSSKLQNAGGQ